VLGRGVARTRALEAPVIQSFLRACTSVTSRPPFTRPSVSQVIGKSTVARVCKDTAVRYAAWCQRDRTKIIGRFPGETPALSLIWAVVDLASRGWRGVTMPHKDVAQIERIRCGQTHATSPIRR
jgi:hypothetical protein